VLRRILAVAFAGALATVSQAVPASAALEPDGHHLGVALAATAPTTVRIAAAGDIACAAPYTTTATTCRHGGTAALIQGRGARAVLPLGDSQYEQGALSDYSLSYDRTWGAFKAKTYPAPGNHEYYTPGASGYYSYFGDRAHGPAGYYAYELGSWRLYALNSQCNEVDCAAEVRWLRQDLAAHPHRCSLAYLHEPRFSSGLHGDSAYAARLWPVLDRRQVDVVLAGHDHDYERFAPMTASGSVSAAGIRSFVVGTGGKELRSFHTVHAGSRVRRNGQAGVLFMTLRSGSYSWGFRTVGGNLRDSGTGSCVS
jgi:hypothetical protein